MMTTMTHRRFEIGDYVRVSAEKSPYYGLVGRVIEVNANARFPSIRIELNDGHQMTIRKNLLEKANLLDILAGDQAED